LYWWLHNMLQFSFQIMSAAWWEPYLFWVRSRTWMKMGISCWLSLHLLCPVIVIDLIKMRLWGIFNHDSITVSLMEACVVLGWECLPNGVYYTWRKYHSDFFSKEMPAPPHKLSVCGISFTPERQINVIHLQQAIFWHAYICFIIVFSIYIWN
jgi:hypothetical protein